MDSITWLRDGLEVRGESTQTQILSDASLATYKHILFSEEISNLVGSLTCRVMDVSGNIVERILALNGTKNMDFLSLSITYTCMFCINKVLL